MYHYSKYVRKKRTDEDKVYWLTSKIEHLLQKLPATGGHRPSLRNFLAKIENLVLGHFIDFRYFDMSDMAYSDR